MRRLVVPIAVLVLATALGVAQTAPPPTLALPGRTAAPLEPSSLVGQGASDVKVEGPQWW